MKVFVLLDDRYNGADAACGVYSTLKAATKARNDLLDEEEDAVVEDFEIEELELEN